MTSNGIVQKLWNYCNILRDDGLSYADYIEQLTFLLFLKMADERQKTLPGQKALIPRDLDWQSLERLDGDDLDTHYRHILVELGKKPGMLGTIFRKAQNKIQDPAKLKRLVSDLIGREQWTILGVDVKGDAYEGLLEKNAADVKGGAGQYFTPRALIRAIVDVMRPDPGVCLRANTGASLHRADIRRLSKCPVRSGRLNVLAAGNHEWMDAGRGGMKQWDQYRRIYGEYIHNFDVLGKKEVEGIRPRCRDGTVSTR